MDGLLQVRIPSSLPSGPTTKPYTSGQRLFLLRQGKKGPVILGRNHQPLYFPDKMSAKAARQLGQVVSLGPDHKLYRGDR
jgi:hypothetical protein